MSKLNLIVLTVCAMMSFALRAEDESNETANSDLTSENTFGLLRVDSTAKETIVAVPWVEAGSDDQPISVKNLISSKNISNGDELFVYLGSYGQYAGYVFDNGEWKSAQNVIKSGLVSQAGDMASTHPRGSALVLRRKDASKPFYLFGQVGKTAPQSLDLIKGGYNLIAPPGDTAVDLNDSTVVEFNGVLGLSNDRIETTDKATGVAIKYMYKNGVWCYTKGRTTVKTCIIQPGEGVWLYLDANSTVTKLTWKKYPKAN